MNTRTLFSPKVSIRNVTISALCVIMCLTATAFALENSLEKMSQASEDVMALVQELQEKMYAEEGKLTFFLQI